MQIIGIVVVLMTLALVFVKRDALFKSSSSKDTLDDDIIDDDDN